MDKIMSVIEKIPFNWLIIAGGSVTILIIFAFIRKIVLEIKIMHSVREFNKLGSIDNDYRDWRDNKVALYDKEGNVTGYMDKP